MNETDLLRRQLDRALQRSAILERMIEDKTRSLYESQRDLAAKSGFLEDVLEAVDGGILVTDSAGSITSINGAAQRLSGYDAWNLLGRSVFDVVNCVGSGRTEKIGLGQCEAVLVRPDGTECSVLVTVSHIRPNGADDDGFVVLITDLTERKRMEQSLARAQKLESLGQLAAGVAHEINTPIQFIGDSTQFLGDVISDLIALIDAHREAAISSGADPDRDLDVKLDVDLDFMRTEAPEAIGRTLDGVRRVSQIVGSLKRFAHPGHSGAVPTDLNELVRQALAVAINEYKYIATVELELGEIPLISANATDLGQVVLNLLINAAHAVDDAGRHGAGSITVRTEVDAQQIRLEMIDNGVGIARDNLERIFEPFFTTKEVGRGSGQGLALVRSVVDAHGGTVTVTSQPGIGTTVSIAIPLVPASPAEGTEPASVPAAQELAA